MRTIVYYLATAGYNEAERERRLAEMAPFIPDGYRIQFISAPKGPEFLDRAVDFDHAISAVADHISTLSPKEYDAIIEGGALDPGLHDARRLARVPVIGPGEAGLFVAAIGGLRTSIVTVDEHAVAAAQRFVDQTATKPEIASIRSMNTPVRTIVSDLERGREALVREASAALREDGAEAIYLGSMTLPTLGLTKMLREELNVPVYDPLRIAIQTAVEVVTSRLGDVNSTS